MAECGKVLTMWDGEYEGECELEPGHTWLHFDGLTWFNDDYETFAEDDCAGYDSETCSQPACPLHDPPEGSVG